MATNISMLCGCESGEFAWISFPQMPIYRGHRYIYDLRMWINRVNLLEYISRKCPYIVATNISVIWGCDWIGWISWNTFSTNAHILWPLIYQWCEDVNELGELAEIYFPQMPIYCGHQYIYDVRMWILGEFSIPPALGGCCCLQTKHAKSKKIKSCFSKNVFNFVLKSTHFWRNKLAKLGRHALHRVHSVWKSLG